VGETAVGETIDRRVTPEGTEIALVRRGDVYEIVYDGTFLMASDCRRSEQALAELGLAPLQRDDITVLVAGLGMGHTLRSVLDQRGVVRVDVVELSDAVVDWNRRYFGRLNGDALADPRVHLHVADLMGFLKHVRHEPVEEVKEGWLSLLLDIDNGPNWLTRAQNAPVYTDEGLARLEGGLRHGGTLAVWSSERDLEFLRRMHARFTNVAELAVPVEVRGKSSLDYVYRGRRKPDPTAARVAGKPVAQA
jgi:predicted membrane-bound spermidine synthase